MRRSRNLKPQDCQPLPRRLSAPESQSSSRMMKSQSLPLRASNALPSMPHPTRPVSAKSTILHLFFMCVATSQYSRKPGIAVIGTRHPTPYGIGMAERLANDLAVRGFVIFSGLARGVDTAAHRGAVAAKGKTVAVFGTGADVVYPKENSRLADQILSAGGAQISEFPMGTFAAPQNFP